MLAMSKTALGANYQRLTLPLAFGLPWSRPAMLQVPFLLLRHTTRYSLGFPCIAAAQLLNWQLLGLDGWWLLLVGGWLAWTPPELPGILVSWLRHTAGHAFIACMQRLQQPSTLRQKQQQEQQQQPTQRTPPGEVALVDLRVVGSSGAPEDGVASMAVQGHAWSSWFWEGSGRQRRQASHHQQPSHQPLAAWQQQGRVSATDGHGANGSVRDRDEGKEGSPRLRTTLRFWVLLALCLYHVLVPLRFLTYPSRCEPA